MACVPFVELTKIPLKRQFAVAFVEETAFKPFTAVNVQVEQFNVPVEELLTPAAADDALIVEPEIVSVPVHVLLAARAVELVPAFNVELPILVVPAPVFVIPACDTKLVVTPETDRVPVADVFAKTDAALSGETKTPPEIVTLAEPDKLTAYEIPPPPIPDVKVEVVKFTPPVPEMTTPWAPEEEPPFTREFVMEIVPAEWVAVKQLVVPETISAVTL